MASDTPETDAALLASVETSEPAPQPPATPPVTPPKRRASAAGVFVSLVAGGALAAGAGFALARFAPDLVAAPRQADAEIAALRAELAALPAPDSTLPDRVAALDAMVQDLAARVESAASRPTATAPDPALAERLQALEQQIASLGSGTTAQPAAITAAVKAAETRLQQAEAKAADLAARAEAAATAARRAAALDRIAAAMDSGTPFAAAAKDLTDLPPALADHAATGLPSVADLRDTFPAAARAALEAALRANMGESWTDRVSSFLRSQTGLRSLSPREGDDPDAILSRAEAALATGNLPAALTELAALPDAAKPPLADWTAQATLRTQAEAAFAALAGSQ